MATGLNTAHSFLGDFSANNRVHNPEFWLAQRLTPTSLTTLSQTSFGPDRWRVQASLGTVGFRRQTNTIPSASGGAAYAGYFEKTGTTGQFGITQFVENLDTVPLAGQTVTFSIWAKANNAFTATTFRLALVSWSGTADAPTAALVSSWAGGTNTYSSNYAEFATSPTATLSTSTWTELKVTAVVPANCANLVLFPHFTNSITNGSGNAVLLTGARLYAGTDTPTFFPRQRPQELAICQRFYEKSYDLDTAPGTGSVSSPIWRVFTVSTTQLARQVIQYQRKIPSVAVTFQIYSAASGGVANRFDGNNVIQSTGIAIAASPTSAWVEGSFTVTANTNNTFGFCWTADSDI